MKEISDKVDIMSGYFLVYGSTINTVNGFGQGIEEDLFGFTLGGGGRYRSCYFKAGAQA